MLQISCVMQLCRRSSLCPSIVLCLTALPGRGWRTTCRGRARGPSQRRLNVGTDGGGKASLPIYILFLPRVNVKRFTTALYGRKQLSVVIQHTLRTLSVSMNINTKNITSGHTSVSLCILLLDLSLNDEKILTILRKWSQHKRPVLCRKSASVNFGQLQPVGTHRRKDESVMKPRDSYVPPRV